MRRSLLAAALVAAAPELAAQEADAVVVTATRQPQPSLEVPASIDRIYADEIREARPQVNLSESLGRVPGIVVQNRQNYAQDLQISSRGFGSRATFGIRGIRLIADGIPATMPDGQGQASTFSLSSAERIEVLRGPFSVLYGNASGGVINVETEDAPQMPTLEGNFLYGSYDTWKAGVRFGGQWNRVNALGDFSRFHTGGYREHSVAIRDQFNGKFKFDLAGATTLTVVANSLRQPQTQDPLGLNRAQLEADPRQAGTGATTFDTRKTVYQEQAGATLNHQLQGQSRIQAMVYGGQRWVEQYLAIPTGVQAAPTHSGGVVQLDRNYGGGALRYFTGWGSVKLSTGAEYDSMLERRRGFLNNNGVAGDLKRDEDDTVYSVGLYVQAEWKPAERWDLHAGLRSSQVHFKSQDYFILPPLNLDDSGEKTYRATTPAAGVVYRVTRETSLYGTVGKGFETPTFAELANRNPGTGSGLNFDLQASDSRHAELGLKTILPGRVRANAAVFTIDTHNEIVVDQSSGGRTSFKNVGSTERNGFELAAETLFGGAFEARFAYTYLKAVFAESFNTAIGTTPVNVPSGNSLPGIPKTQIYGELRYRRESHFVQLEALSRSRVPVNDQNSDFADAYTVANVIGGLTQQGQGWRVLEYLRVDNLTDRNYVGSVIVNEGNSRFFEPSPRRSMTVGIQASLQF